MAKRVQSPSSIKTYLQCPRKYYYQYIAKMPRTSSIHTVRGNIAHGVLEDFFDTPVTGITSVSEAQPILRSTIQSLLVNKWQTYKDELDKLELPQEELVKYFEETMMMLFNWLNTFTTKLSKLNKSFEDSFKTLTPVREREYKSTKLQVRGFIDAIEHIDGIIRIMDYKTNKSMDIDHHRFQLGVYALMYMEEHGKMPDFAGIYFLRGQEETLAVDQPLMQDAQKKIIYTHSKTDSEDKRDYPLKIQPLCKWRTGQCEFYEMCFKGQSEQEFLQLRTTDQNSAKESVASNQ